MKLKVLREFSLKNTTNFVQKRNKRKQNHKQGELIPILFTSKKSEDVRLFKTNFFTEHFLFVSSQ
jgi:hypothetical protein